MRSVLLAEWVCVGIMQAGCSGAYPTASVDAAQARLDQARQMGAESAAPYEYYNAKEHLRQARLSAFEARYRDAATYAETAETYAERAIALVEATKQGAPRK